jgi:hypothetical protein
MLRDLAEMAQEASFGSMSGGEARAVARYNSVLAHLEEDGLVPKSFFLPIEAGAEFGDVAVEARLLGSYLKGNGDGGDVGGREDFAVVQRLAPFVDSAALGDLIRGQIRKHGRPNVRTLTGLAPFLDRGFLNELVRTSMDFEAPGPTPTPSQESEPESPQPEFHAEAINSTNERMPEVSPQEELNRLAERLTDPTLSPEERRRIAVRLSELAYEQGSLARD